MNPVAVIHGATGGIGSALARRLAGAGWGQLLVARNEERLEGLAGEIGGEWMAEDVARPGGADRAMERAMEHFGRVDAVVNCVGSLLLKPAHLTSDEEWEQVIAANLTSAFLTLRAAVRVMRDKGGGSVVLLSSAAATRGLTNHEGIAAAKAGVEGLALAAAASYAPSKIRVNVVAPGLVRTPMTAGLMRSEMAMKASLAMHALGRVGEPEEVASAIHWLADPAQGWVTGQALGVDGGLSRVQARMAV